MTRIAAVHGVLAPHRHAQHEITDMVADTCLPVGSDRRVLDRLHHSAKVGTRHTVLPLDRYAALDGFGAVNDAFIDGAVRLGAEAVSGALEEAGLSPRDVDLLMFTSVTGIAAPSVDARLAGRLGCGRTSSACPSSAWAVWPAPRASPGSTTTCCGRPDDVAVLLSVELCTLTFQRDDTSTANLVATALFGDGAAAVVACGARRRAGPGGVGPGLGARAVTAGPQVVDTRSHLYPDTEEVMGWHITSAGFRVVLDASVPDVVRKNLAADVDGFLADHGLRRADITAWVCHPGGPKVLEAVAESLDLPEGALDVTWRSLASVGNLSSASVLHVLRDTLAERRPPAGTPGLLLAMGPGFCSELVLLRW